MLARPYCMDESNGTCGKRLASIGLENTEANCHAYRTLLATAPGLGKYISGAILFKDYTNPQLMATKWLTSLLNKTLFLVSTSTRVWYPLLVQMMSHGAMVPSSLCQMVHRSEHSQRTICIGSEGSSLGFGSQCSHFSGQWFGLSCEARLLDVTMALTGHLRLHKKFRSRSFFNLAENNVMFGGILLKPSMVTPGAECKDRATPEKVADYTPKLLQRRIPSAVPGIMALNSSYLVDNQKLRLSST